MLKIFFLLISLVQGQFFSKLISFSKIRCKHLCQILEYPQYYTYNVSSMECILYITKFKNALLC